MDNTLLLVLIGTGLISILTVIYVLLDERSQRKQFQQQSPSIATDPSQHVAAATPEMDKKSALEHPTPPSTLAEDPPPPKDS